VRSLRAAVKVIRKTSNGFRYFARLVGKALQIYNIAKS
jgi:hypothetical protein